jgi:hypothetical protein
MWIGLFSIIIKYIGFYLYAYVHGNDHSFFDFMYLLFQSTSDSIIIVLIILLGYGWTVHFNSNKDFDLYVPLVSIIGLLNIIMNLLNKVSDG